MKDKITRITGTIPEALHTEVRIQAFKKRIKINDLLTELLSQWLARQNKGDKKAA